MLPPDGGKLHLRPATQEAGAGAIGGALGVLAGHPLDTLRVRTQQPGAGSPRAVWTATLAGEGGRALFKGLSSPLAAAAAQNALCFHTFASAMRALAEEPPESAVAADLKRPHSHTHVFLAGCAAGVATTALATPIELLKVQLQVRVGRGGGPLALAASILAREGPAGLYRGASITLARDAPSTGVYYVVYEAAREALGGRGAGADGATLLAGGAAGVASWASIYPLDVVKSRVQAAPGRYAGWVDCARQSVRSEGWSVLTRGLSACLLRAALVNAAIFGGYEAGLDLLRSL